MKGFASVHPSTEKRLRRCGIKDADVTQGVGNYKLSAGTHKAVGVCQGRAFGSCVDLRMDCIPDRIRFDRLVAAGFAPFRRDWAGNRHWHVVDCTTLKKDGGVIAQPRPLVRVQMLDFCDGLSGLVDHAPIEDAWRPDEQQRIRTRMVIDTETACGVVYVTYGVLPVNCYAYLERGSVRCELRPLVEALGGVVRWEVVDEAGYLRVSHGSKAWHVALTPAQEKLWAWPTWKARIEGSFVRCALRPVAESLGHVVEWDAANLRAVIA
jgi:hypothetical protein